MINMIGLGNPTTCGYFHIWNEESQRNDFNVEQFFECSGLGIAFIISDHFVHSFLAYGFRHKMTLCLLFSKIRHSYLWSNHDNIFNLFAWGSSGKGVRKKKKKSKGGRRMCDNYNIL